MGWPIRRRCRRLVANLDLPDPFGLAELCRRAARPATGRLCSSR